MAETPKVFRFYKISEANSEILRLDGLLAAANAKLESVGSNDSEISDQATVLRNSNETLSAEVSRLTKELDTAKADAVTARAEATRAKSDADARVEKDGAARALQITAAQGQPPIAQTQAANPAGEPAKPELKGLQKVRAAFLAENKK